MPRPAHRIRNRDYEWLVTLQGGEYCKKCGEKPQKLGTLHVDEIDDNKNNQDPRNKQLLCDICNGIKELERRRKVRQGKRQGGDSLQNSECVRAQMPTSVVVGPRPATQVTKPASPEPSAVAIDAELERQSSRTSSETKHEDCFPVVDAIIKMDWNRQKPTLGLVYPRCIYEISRRCEQELGHGAPATVKRHILTICSDGADWRISPRTKRIVPRNYEEHDPDEGLTAEEIAANHRRIADQRFQDLQKEKKEKEEWQKRALQLEKELKQQQPQLQMKEEKST